ncbi:MAG: hypothetical protein ACKVOU_09905 [Cytophagales bacterium]
MKKTILIAFVLVSNGVLAQLKVISNGNVGIGNPTPSAKLQVNGVGGANVDFRVNGRLSSNNSDGGLWCGEGNTFVGGFQTNKIGFWNQGWHLAVLNNGNVGIGTLTPQSSLHIATSGNSQLRIQSNNNVGLANSAGIDFLTFGGTSVPNARIAAVDQGNARANIDFYTVACYNCPLRKTFSIDYNGNAFLTGELYKYQGFNWSDKKLKTSIKTAEDALQKVLQMRGVYYTAVDSIEIEEDVTISDTTQLSQSNTYANNKSQKTKKKYPYASNLNSKQQYGFVAQEMEKVIPEAVKDTKLGLKAVNYESIIPILVEAIKGLNSKNEALEAKVKKLEKGKSNARTESTTGSIESITGTYLYQNTPNPFSLETQIRYAVPENAGNAFITITDLTGKQIKTLPIATKGESFVTLKANELYAGLFAYTLVVDGNIIDTKRMVIVE